MPELPEVETIKRDLVQVLPGLQIQDIKVYDERVLKGLTPKAFVRNIQNRGIDKVARVGKAVVLCFDNGTFLIVQVKMTGHLIYGDNLRSSDDSRDTKVVFNLSNGRFLNYNDQRLFGWLIWTEDLQSVPYVRTLGPDPLNGAFTSARLKKSFVNRTSAVKVALMNQQLIAGIGNIYASEILFDAGIDPRTPANRLTSGDVKKIHASTVKILKKAVECRGTSMRNYRDSSGEKGAFMERIRVYGRAGQSCVRCGQPLQRIVQTGRSTFFCARCQPKKRGK